MTSEELLDLKFPIGKFIMPDDFPLELKKNWIRVISEFPDALLNEVSAISKEQKKSKYRPDGWSLTQVVHHCADSHMNAFIRFKLALTEENPTIRPYLEDEWGELSDSNDRDLMPSVNLLIGLHERWALLLENMSGDEFERGYFHPETNAIVSLKEALGTYAWHSEHHLKHVKMALEANGKYNAKF